MSFLDYIEKIRKEPEEKRVKILYTIVGLFMVIIVFLWVINLNSIIFGENNNIDVSKKDSISPFSVITSRFSNLAGFVVTQVKSFGSEKVEVFSRNKDNK